VPCYTQKIPDVNGPAAAKSQPTGSSTATTSQVKSERDKLKREADLSAVRAKLNPFGAKRVGLEPEKAK
jgi:phospholipid/cholesterol/gamma-HCH transport system substrate-binding protein